MMEDELHPILVQALLEHEGIGGLSGNRVDELIIEVIWKRKLSSFSKEIIKY